MPSLTEALGYAGTVTAMTMMVPQVIKAFRTKEMKDVSQWTVVLYLLNCALWLSYGLRLAEPPLIVANGIGLAVGIVQLGLKARYG